MDLSFARLRGPLLRVKRLRVGGEAAVVHVIAVLASRAGNLLAKIDVLAGEFRRAVDAQADEIVENEHLAVAIGAGADADGRDAKFLRDARSEFARHGFEDDGKSSGGFDGARVTHQTFGGFDRFSLNAKAAEFKNGLRREADVRHHGDFRFDEARNRFHALFATLEFHRFGAVFHKAQRVANSFLGRNVKCAEGHVRDEEGATGSAADGANVMQHFVERDGKRVVIAEDDHAERVADEKNVYAGFVEKTRGGIVVRSEAGDSMRLIFEFAYGKFALKNVRHGDFHGARTGSDAHVDLRCRPHVRQCRGVQPINTGIIAENAAAEGVSTSEPFSSVRKRTFMQEKWRKNSIRNELAADFFGVSAGSNFP